MKLAGVNQTPAARGSFFRRMFTKEARRHEAPRPHRSRARATPDRATLAAARRRHSATPSAHPLDARPIAPTRSSSSASIATSSSASTLDALGRMDHDRATAELKSVIAQLIEEQTTPLSQRDRDSLRDEILHEVAASARSSRCMRDPEVSDILVNTSRQVVVERMGKLEPRRSSSGTMRTCCRSSTASCRGSAGRIDESSPMVDARSATDRA
jgi:pilus assembly protein CpaF